MAEEIKTVGQIFTDCNNINSLSEAKIQKINIFKRSNK